MDAIFQNLGIWSAIVGACIALAIVQSLLLILIAALGKSIWKRVTRTYALHVVWYWLSRLEMEGAHCFEKAHADAATDQEGQQK